MEEDQLIINKPDGATALSLIGGLLGIIFGLTYWSITISPVFGVWVAIWALFIIIVAIRLYTNPEKHEFWSSIICVASVLQGLNLIALVGGIWGHVWKPKWKPKVAPKSFPTRICLECGKVLTEDIKFCPDCGKKLVYSDETDPLKIVKIRYAKGEISKEEYEEIKKMLEES